MFWVFGCNKSGICRSGGPAGHYHVTQGKDGEKWYTTYPISKEDEMSGHTCGPDCVCDMDEECEAGCCAGNTCPNRGLKERIRNAMKLPGQSILIDPDDLNEEFVPGKVGFGFITPLGGLYFATDWDDPEPGFLLVVGPFYLWRRRYWGAHVGFYCDF